MDQAKVPTEFRIFAFMTAPRERVPTVAPCKSVIVTVSVGPVKFVGSQTIFKVVPAATDWSCVGAVIESKKGVCAETTDESAKMAADKNEYCMME